MFHALDDGSPDLLAEWRWLVGGRAKLQGWSSAGDLFYDDQRAAIWRLDLGAGVPERVAASKAAFADALTDRDQAEELLLLPVLRAYEEQHGPLAPGSCLGYITLPVFGGSYTAENRYAITVEEFAGFTGDLHRQLRDRPDGTSVRIELVP